MMTALLVLSLLVLLIAQLFASATSVTKLSTVRLDADTQARLVFDRMATDFTWMLRRPDVDFHFVKQADNNSAGAAQNNYSDTFFFFSEVPGYFNSAESTANESNTSLIGYRINPNPNTKSLQLERMAWGLTWDPDATPGYPLVYLTFSNFSNGLGSVLTDYTPTPASTIVGQQQWAGIDNAQSYNTADNQPNPGSNFHVLGDSVFRLEFCFLLNDGTYSVVPAINYTLPSGVAANNKLNATAPPQTSQSGYVVGSRWYDATNYHAYICTNGTANAETWKPLGMADVQGVVVTIAILDQSSQKLLGGKTAPLQAMAQALVGPQWSPTTGTLLNSLSSQSVSQNKLPVLPATNWLNTVNQANFATTIGIPKAVASQVRIYQRIFYLNNTL